MPKLRKKPNEEKAKKFNALLLERTEILGIEIKGHFQSLRV